MGEANIVPFLSKLQWCNPLEYSQDYLGWRCHWWKADEIAELRSRATKRVYKSGNGPVRAFSACVMLQGIYSRTIGPLFSSLVSSSPRTGMSAKQTVEDAIAANKIVIFSKTWCPYCKRAKSLLTLDFAHLKDQIYIKECVPFSLRLSPKLTVVPRLDEAPNGSEIQNYLRDKTGQSSVPNIFINKKHIGGKYLIPIDSHPISPADDFSRLRRRCITQEPGQAR